MLNGIFSLLEHGSYTLSKGKSECIEICAKINSLASALEVSLHNAPNRHDAEIKVIRKQSSRLHSQNYKLRETVNRLEARKVLLSSKLSEYEEEILNYSTFFDDNTPTDTASTSVNVQATTSHKESVTQQTINSQPKLPTAVECTTIDVDSVGGRP